MGVSLTMLGTKMTFVRDARLLLVVVTISLVTAVAMFDMSASQVQATRITLVSNLTATGSLMFVGEAWSSDNIGAQRFTTGASGSTTNLSAVTIELGQYLPENLAASGMRVSLWSASSDANSVPDAELGAFTNPTFPAGTLERSPIQGSRGR